MTDRITTTSGSPDHTPGEPRQIPLAALLDAWQIDAQEAYEARRDGVPRGPVTRFQKLDAALGEALQPGLHVLHGGPGIGKTSFALQVGATCGFPCLYLTAEMDPLELLRRLTARVTKTFLGRLKTGELHPEESLTLARRAVAAVPNMTLLDATCAYARPDWILKAAEQTRGDSRSLLLVVDSVHSWVEAGAGEASEYEAVGTGLQALRQIAARLRCPVLAISERNRAKMEDGGLHSAASNRKFEYGGASVIGLDKEDPKAEPDGAGEFAVSVTLSKNRNGRTGKATKLMFHGALQQWREV